MENKHYIPIIDEFHRDFIYESKLLDGSWANISWSILDSFLDLYNNINSENIRVKYLDKEDIEGMGFESGAYEDMDDTGIYNMYSIDRKKPMYIITINENSTILEIKITREKLLRNPAFDTIFKGDIKNKSELIKLLKQLGIND